jgi:hypothetical protein
MLVGQEACVFHDVIRRFVGFHTKAREGCEHDTNQYFPWEIKDLVFVKTGGTPVAIEAVRRPCLAREWRHKKTDIGTKGTSGSRLRNLLF